MLPRDIFIAILLYLEPPDFKYVGSVCKSWLSFTRNQQIMTCHHLIWKSLEVQHIKNRVMLYPGLEKYLDFYHCLARAVKRSHYPAVLYFLSKAADKINRCEIATLLDLLTTYWHDGIFRILIRRYIDLFPDCYNTDLFKNLPIQLYQPHMKGFPQPAPITSRSDYIFRQPLYDPPPNVQIKDWRQGLVVGYKEYLKGRRGRDFPANVMLNMSSEICIMICNLG